MSIEKPAGGAAVIQARCEICRYVRRMRATPTDITPTLQCFRFPPSASALPTQGGTVVLTARPVMAPNDMCYEFKHDPARLKDAPAVLASPDQKPEVPN